MKTTNLTKTAALSILVATSFFSCSDDDNDAIEINDGTPTSVELYTSNNADGNITVYDVTDQSAVTTKTLITAGIAADGVYYDSTNDFLLQASRTDLGLEGYNNTNNLVSGSTLAVDVNGTNDMQSPREVAVNGNFIVVADNADVDGDLLTPDGRLYIYTKEGNNITLRNTITTSFKLWGITFDNNNLYAVVDATNELAVFSDFLSNTTDMALASSKRIFVEGIVRTHGLTFDASSDVMILTDIADATNGQDDGAFHYIENFTSKFNGVANAGALSAAQQVRVSGASTLLGNPVDVAYDSATQTVYIAEAGNGGGRILAFNNFQAGGNITPILNNSLAAASAVYLSK
ncbi:hypothetical protein [Psychroserpens sp. NJDZ02]|uniref:hypothetical protein n=1 Tax=Psychroserpens sp. NJDZ02 TaxID=2570561 RepID=UPI0010A8B7DA|nr:hypothetical protein [Psychroserpens sp. NJDZ02]QCE42815.1 hypothetical protein E9099_15825 [Psychroserpens sp. NJDZ02]